MTRLQLRSQYNPGQQSARRAAAFFGAFWLFGALGSLAFLSGCGGHREGAGGSKAGGKQATVSPLAIRLVEAAPSGGITYQYPPLPHPLGTKEAFGVGCAFFDYDNDGWQDVLLVTQTHPYLYHNLGNGRFQDVSGDTGLDTVAGDWRGCAVGDVDGDGHLDILLTGFHRLALLHNEGRHRFTDITRAAGLDPANHGHWGSSAGFMDLDGDGQLDLVILNYVVFGPKSPDFCELTPGVRTGCPPTTYHEELPEVWHNVGGGRFGDVSAASGIRTAHGKALVVTFINLAGTGHPDFYIGNDGLHADLMRNQGGMRFRNGSILSGLDVTQEGNGVSAMGADWADYDRDGRLDLAVSNFSSQPYQLYHSLGNGVFEHRETAVGLAQPSFNPLGFGAKWADVDNDGWPDLIFVNGHVYDDPGAVDHFSTFRQPMMLFHNEAGRHFTDLAPSLGGDLTEPLLGRGLATGDYDNDGRVDLLVVDYGGRPRLLHNLTQPSGHWITFDLHGKAPNTFAYGARVTARAAGQVWAGYVSPASSYLSSSDPRIHFGLGPTATLDSVEIAWPDGRRQTLRRVLADRILRLDEEKGAPSR